MTIPYCKTRPDVPFLVDKPSRYTLKMLEEEKRFLDHLAHEEFLKSAGNARGHERKQFTDICNELRKEKVEEFLEKKRRQKLVQSTEELRQLNVRISLAYSFKQLKDQTKREEDARKEQLRLQHEENMAARRNFALSNQKYEEEKHQEILSNAEHRKILLEQIEEIQKNRKLSIAEINIERERIQKWIDNYDAKEEAARIRNEKMKMQTKLELDKIVESHKVIEKALKEDEKELLRRGAEFIKMKDKQKLDRELLAKEKFAERERSNEVVFKKLGIGLSDKTAREEVLENLLIKERKAIDDANYHNELMRKKRESLIHRNEMLQDINYIREKRRYEREEGVRRWKQESEELRQLINEEEEKERNTMLQKQKDLTEALFEAMNYKRQLATNLYTEKRLEYERGLQAEKKRMEDIQTERLALLKKEPKEILLCLPKGTLSLEETIALGLREKRS